MSRVFLSHASSDKEVARRVAATLRSAGHEVWLDEAALQPGDQVLPTIAEAIERSDAVVVLVSEASQSSSGLDIEAALAAAKVLGGRGGVVIPVLLGPGVEVPYPLQTFQALRLDPGNPEPGPLVRALARPNRGGDVRIGDVVRLQREAIDLQRLSFSKAEELYEVARVERQQSLTMALSFVATVLAIAIVIALVVVRREASIAALSGASVAASLITASTAMSSLVLRRAQIRQLRERVAELEQRILAGMSEPRIDDP